MDIHPGALHVAVVDVPLIGASLQRADALGARARLSLSLSLTPARLGHVTGGALAGSVMVEDSYWVLTEGDPVSVEVSLLKKPPFKEIWAAVFAAD